MTVGSALKSQHWEVVLPVLLPPFPQILLACCPLLFSEARPCLFSEHCALLGAVTVKSPFYFRATSTVSFLLRSPSAHLFCFMHLLGKGEGCRRQVWREGFHCNLCYTACCSLLWFRRNDGEAGGLEWKHMPGCSLGACLLPELDCTGKEIPNSLAGGWRGASFQSQCSISSVYFCSGFDHPLSPTVRCNSHPLARQPTRSRT